MKMQYIALPVIAAAMIVAPLAPARADWGHHGGWGGGYHGGYGGYHGGGYRGGYYHHGYGGGGLFYGIAAGVGVLTGAALAIAAAPFEAVGDVVSPAPVYAQPVYQQPVYQQQVYAPAPSYYSYPAAYQQRVVYSYPQAYPAYGYYQ